MKPCDNCWYYFQEDYELVKTCHMEESTSDKPAPCEMIDWYEEDI